MAETLWEVFCTPGVMICISLMAVALAGVAVFAYDTPNDWEPLVGAAAIMSKAGLIGKSHVMRCYVLIGWEGDTIEAAEARLQATMKLGYMPFAMLYNLGTGTDNTRGWKRFQRTWANAVIVGSKMKEAQ